MQKLLSIIIPVYNKEKYIKRCLDSVISQVYTNIEIIIVDDGSTDNSFKIIREYIDKDQRIRIISKANGGVSSARNDGIKNARGEYIQFIDADDYIDNNMCSILMNRIIKEGADIAICGYKVITTKCIKFNSCINKIVQSIEEIKDEFSNLYVKPIFNSPVNKIYKKNNIIYYFDEKVSLGEDLLFNIKNIISCNKIVFIEESLYNYMVEDSNSLTAKYREDRFDSALYLYKEMNKFCDNYNIDDQYRWGLSTVLINNVIGSIQELVYNLEIDSRRKRELIEKRIRNKNVVIANKHYKKNNRMNSIISKLIKNKNTNLIYIIIKIKYKVCTLVSLKKKINNIYRKGD